MTARNKPTDEELVEVTVREDDAVSDGTFEGGDYGFYPAGTKIKVSKDTADSLKAKRLI
jgi:hypothetical protein